MAHQSNPQSNSTSNYSDQSNSRRTSKTDQRFMFEPLETRQMMSTAVMLATHAVLSNQSSPLAENDALIARATPSTLTARFINHITAEVETHLHNVSSVTFQAHIENEQVKFAAQLAKQGGDYTPISFSSLVATASANKAAKLSLKIGKETTAFTTKLFKEIQKNTKKLTSPKFQAKIANEQIKFAAKIARAGGTYTIIPFSDLVLQAGGPPVVGTAATIPTLVFTVPSATEIDLTWNAITGALAYKLERSLDGTNWSTIASPSGTSYNNYGLTADTAYRFRISTINSGGTVGPSTVTTVSTLLLPPTKFAAKTTSATAVNLTWVAVTHASTYKIERSVDGAVWTVLAASSALTGSSTSLSDTTATAGSSYFYRISATNSAGTSASANPVTVTTLPAQPVVTAASISASEIDLTWPAVLTAYSFKLETSLNGVKWSSLATLSTNSYNHTGLTANSTHYYRLSAISGAGTSAVSAAVNKKTLLGAPAGFKGLAASATSIGLSWIVSTDSTSYKLERSADNTTWAAITPGTAFTHSTTTYTDTGLTAGTTYYYRLSAISATGTSVPTTAITTSTLRAAPVVTGTVTSATAVALTWPAVTGATGYKIETSVNNGVTWSVLVANQAGLTYAHTGLIANTTHKYRVTTLSATGPSVASPVVSLTTFTSAPTSLTISVNSATSIHLGWSTVAGSTGYKLERSADGSTNWTTLAASSGFTSSSTSADDTGLTAGTTYYYRLSAVQGSVITSATAVVHALTNPAQPVVTAVPVSASAVNISWGAITSATSYQVEVSGNGGSSWSSSSQAGVTYAATGLTADTSYQFRVTAINATGNSVTSTVVTQATLLTAPTSFTATVNSATSAHLVWTPVADATGYKLERSANNTTWAALTTSFTGSSASFDDTTATAGTTFYYRLSSISAAGASTPTSAAQILTLPGTTTLTGVVTSASVLTLNWTAVTSATSYLLETSADGSTWSSLATQSTLTYANTGLNADSSHQYRVTAINATGNGVTTAALTLKTVLGAPVSFAAVVNSATSVGLSWTANADVVSYKIERSTGSTASYAALTQSPALTSSSSSFTDTTAVAGTSYSYRISGTNTLGTSVPSSVVTVLTLPAVPVLTATANTVSQITLTWPTVQSATGYKLEYSADSGTTWSTLVNANQLTFVHTGLVVDTSYKYRITAFNGTGNGVTSSAINGITLLAAPTGFTATGNSATSIGLAWNSVTDATSIKIERSLDNTAFTALTPAAGNATSFTDTVLGGTHYYYRISAVDAAGTSLATSVNHVLTVPVAPVLTTTLVSATQINLAWNASTGATSYRVDTSADGTTWTPVISTAALTFNDTGLSSDTTYRFRVVAVDASGPSASSNVPAAITTYVLPPAGFAAAVTTATNVNLTWTAVTDAVTYKVERSPDATTWTGLSGATALTQSTVAFADTTVVGGTQYYYRISAINTVGPSAVSAAVGALTLPATPTLTATGLSTTSVSLTWTAVTGAHTYKVETSLDGGTNWTTLGTPSVLTYTVTGLSADTSYKYRVSGVNATGASVPSTVSTITTRLVTPSSFVAVAGSATTTLLGWSAETDATGYKIERSSDNVSWTTLAGSSALVGSDTSLVDTGLTAGTPYYYRLSSNSVGGYSTPTSAVRVLTLPVAPTQSGTVFSATQINLTWSPVFSATGYEVLQATTVSGVTSWADITPQPVGTATSLSITGLTADTNYIYQVRALNPSGSSAPPSVAINLTTTLAAPTTFIATASTDTAVTLSWDAIAHATNYLLQRSADGGAYTTVTPGTPWDATSAGYSDTGLTGGTTYSYKLTAIDAAGNSAPSTASVLTKPSAPTLAGSATSSTAVRLTWAAIKSATSYTLQSYDGTNWTNVSPGPVGAVTSLNITGQTADTAYTYRLLANNATGASVASSQVVVTTILPAPASFAATSTAATTTTLTFTAAAHATSYLLQRSLDNTIWSTVTQSLGASDATFTDTGLAAGTRYYYRMAAIDASGTSTYSTANTTTLPVAPTLAGIVTSSTALNFTWNSVKSATSYTLQLSDGSGGWTTVSPGPVGAVTNFAVTGLTADTAYTYQLVANNATGASLGSTSVSLTTTLAAPASFAATSPTATSVGLSWTAIAHANSYVLKRSTDGVIFTTLAQSLTSSDHTFTDSTVAAGTSYTYRLSAVDASGTSAVSSTTILTLPVAPTLSIDTVSDTSLLLSWTASASATGYTVNLGTTVSGTTTWAAVTPGPVGTANSLLITGLTADTSYDYQVIATNGTGNSVASATTTGTTLLSAPASFTATDTSATTVHLAWTAITDSTGYLLERSVNGVIWTAITPAPTGGAGTTSYDDTTTVGGTTYQYRLSAISAAGTSAASTVATVLTKPAAPVISGLTASETELDLSWTPVSSATSYTLEVSADGSTNWTAVSPAPVGTATTISITGLTANTTYHYRVEANNATGASVASNTLDIATLAGAPASFAGTTTASSTVLTWTAVTNATGYVIEQSTDGNTWTTLNTGSLTGTSATFTDNTVTAGTAYQYRISTVSALGVSDPSSAITVTTPLVAPTGLAAVVNSATQITLNWNLDTDSGLTGFRLEQSPDGTNGSWVAVATLNSASTTTAVTGLATATAYHFRLFAVSAGGDSAPTAQVIATTL